MIKKSTRPHPKNSETDWDRFWKTMWNGHRPILNLTTLVTGIPDANTKRAITYRINLILDKNKAIKIGKTGDTHVRTDQKDYRGNYTHMHLVYRSTSQKFVSELEAHYIQKYKAIYPDRVDNVALHSGGKMSSYDGYYYLYVVSR